MWGPWSYELGWPALFIESGLLAGPVKAGSGWFAVWAARSPQLFSAGRPRGGGLLDARAAGRPRGGRLLGARGGRLLGARGGGLLGARGGGLLGAPGGSLLDGRAAGRPR